MSKVLDATCVNNKVTCEGSEVPNVTVLSEGVAESSGLLILEDDRKTYVPKTSPDLKAALELIISALTAIDNNGYIIASGSPDTPGGPKATSSISSLSSLKDSLK